MKKAGHNQDLRIKTFMYNNTNSSWDTVAAQLQLNNNLSDYNNLEWHSAQWAVQICNSALTLSLIFQQSGSVNKPNTQTNQQITLNWSIMSFMC